MKRFLTACILSLLMLPTAVLAGGATSFSVTPTLFQMAASPGQSWSSTIKVINNNSYPLTLYANVVNFAPQGETGRGQFIPIAPDDHTSSTIAAWIAVPKDAMTVGPDSSHDIPISVHIPKNATPGGHFAAIMIGTRPPKTAGKDVVSTSQIVTSLFFARVAGDVVEKGMVRSFTAQHGFAQQPRMTFDVRFENQGNVLLQPQGEIDITNMWGQKRGVIPINQDTQFGNVLPKSIRKYQFTWKGEQTISDIGRYTASLTLGYGQDARHFVTAKTSFWVIPVKAVTIVLGSLLAIIWFITWSIKSYVRRMLALSVDAYVPRSQRATLHFAQKGDVKIEKKRSKPSVRAPIEAGMTDLRARLKKVNQIVDVLRTLGEFVWQYWKFFAGVALLMVVVVVVSVYFRQVFKHGRNYEVTIDNPGAPVTLSSEKIMYDQEHANAPVATTTATAAASSTEQSFRLDLVNAGDTPGAAAALKQQLLPQGYIVNSLGSDLGPAKPKTVIVYDQRAQTAALKLSKMLGNALMSAAPATTTATATVTVYIGNDFKF